jgi:prevent-host-death family protein
MATYSVAEAKDQLSKLIREAEEGEEVNITRHGRVVARLQSTLERPRRRPSQDLVDRIVERAKTRARIGENGVDVVRRMRDGEIE